MTVTSYPCQRRPELFFAHRPQPLELAKQLCRGCAAQDWCLAGALERGESWGVWGGEIVVDGAVVHHKRGPGRPRKDVVA
jgi:WhiB family redox-sensing transcriptional regulator